MKNKYSRLEVGQTAFDIDGRCYRVVSKVSSLSGTTIKLADMYGKSVHKEVDLVSPAMAKFASFMRFHLAYNKLFDPIINEYCEKASLPTPIGPDGKPFRWANWFQTTISPILSTPFEAGSEDEQEVKDEAIQDMLFTEMSSRQALVKFPTAIKNFYKKNKNVETMPVAQQLTFYLTSLFRFKVSEMNRKIGETHAPYEVSMDQPGDEGETINVLDTQEHAVKPKGVHEFESDQEIDNFRDKFFAWLDDNQTARAANGFKTLFDMYVSWSGTSTGDRRSRQNLEEDWAEQTDLGERSLHAYVGRLGDLLDKFITKNRGELGGHNTFVKLFDRLREERERLKRKQEQQETTPEPVKASLDAAMKPITGGSPAMSLEQLHEKTSSDPEADPLSDNSAKYTHDRKLGTEPLKKLKGAAGPISPQQMMTQNIQKSQGAPQPPANTNTPQPPQEQQPLVAVPEESGAGQDTPMRRTVPPELGNEAFHMSGADTSEERDVINLMNSNPMTRDHNCTALFDEQWYVACEDCGAIWEVENNELLPLDQGNKSCEISHMASVDTDGSILKDRDGFFKSISKGH